MCCRASLTEHKHALLLLFKSIDWGNQRHVKQVAFDVYYTRDVCLNVCAVSPVTCCT